MTTWSIAHQNETLEAGAQRRGDTWTLADLEMVEAFGDDVSDTELATALGRTLYAIWAIKSEIARNGVAPRTQRATRCPERAYTGLPGDEFPE